MKSIIRKLASFPSAARATADETAADHDRGKPGPGIEKSKFRNEWFHGIPRREAQD
jgi:hypothetical protein